MGRYVARRLIQMIPVLVLVMALVFVVFRLIPGDPAQLILGANPDFVCVSVAKGEAAMCVHQISEIMPVKGVTLVGPLPKDVQKVTVFAVAPGAKAGDAAAATAFARFLARADLKARFAKAGLDYK